MNVNSVSCRLRAIEMVILKMLESNPPKLEIRDWRKLKNLCFTDRFEIFQLKDLDMLERYYFRVIMQSVENSEISYIKFNHSRSRQLFTCVIHLLVKIYKMIKTNTWCTKREIYYQEIDVMNSQQVVDRALMVLCYILNCPPWELNIMSSSKGLVAGPLLIKTCNEEIIDCFSPGGTLIPHIISARNTELKSTAKYVLLIEKDATFQKMLSQNILCKLQDSLLITGKGYPDVYTRILVKKLNERLQLPVLALFDSDPDGISIMCVYRFGSASLSCFANNLATPGVKWLGIHPSDFETKSIITLPLEESDVRKLRSLAKKQYVLSNTKILEQVNVMLRMGCKAEIEAIHKISPNFLIEEYIRLKILNNELY